MPDEEVPWMKYQRLQREQGPPKPITDLPQNIVRSGGAFLGQLWDAAKGVFVDEKGNPISFQQPLGRTPTAMGNLLLGTAEKFAPGRGPHEQYPEAVGEHLAQRYNLSNIGKTAYEDPVGTAADLSMFLGAGSLALRAPTTVARMANLPRTAAALAKTGETLNVASAVTDPIRIGFNVVTAPLRSTKLPVVSRLNPENLYQGALKPRPGSYSREKVQSMIRTGLEEGIPVSDRGYNKLYNLIVDLNNKVKTRIDAATERGITVSPEEVARRVDEIMPKFREQVGPEADVSALRSKRAEFLRQHQTQAPFSEVLPSLEPGGGYFPVSKGTVPVSQPIPADLAQRIKVNTYQQLKGKFGELKSAEIEAEKALARGIKEELASQIPEIAEINLREGKALGLLPELEHAIRRTGNWEVFGLGAPAAAGGTLAATGSKELAATMGFVAALLRNPAVKSQLAIAIYQGMKANPAKYGIARMSTATARANEYIERLRQRTEGTEAAPAIAAP